MIIENLKINGIPAVLWGEKSDKLFIAVHGNMSNKTDDVIKLFAEKVVLLGYQVLSFDLPEHGERKNENTPCKVQFCVKDLCTVMEYAKDKWDNISLFACSMGAYFSLLAYKDDNLKQSLFLSPVVNMKRIIDNMMLWFNVSEQRLMEEKEIATPIGQMLYWDYYSYVKENPINQWNTSTSILYGANDNLCEVDTVSDFAEAFGCKLQIMDSGEHYFHTNEQLEFFGQWLDENLV